MNKRNSTPIGRWCSYILALALAGAVACTSAQRAVTVTPVRPASLPATPVTAARPSGASVGLVLTGGGAFGAWEVGALEAFFDWWHARYHEDPPIRVVAGTSTGALIAPFALLGRGDISYAAEWYKSVTQSEVVGPKFGAVLPFPLFAITTSSVYGVGYTPDPANAHARLYGRLVTALTQDHRLDRLRALWPSRRMVAATLDFGNGCPDDITNAPEDMQSLEPGILASAMAPLALPPVPLTNHRPCAIFQGPTLHFDGGVDEVAPFTALFNLAAVPPAISLTHVVVISAFPMFPGLSGKEVQHLSCPRKNVFSNDSKFRAIGDRMNALLSEAGATHEIALARAAIELRNAGKSPAEVARITGLTIPGPSPDLIVLAPTEREGWEAFRFIPAEMRMMWQRGYDEARAELTAATGTHH